LPSDSRSHPPAQLCGRACWVAILAVIGTLFAASGPSAFADLPAPATTHSRAVGAVTNAVRAGTTRTTGAATGETDARSAATETSDARGGATGTTDARGGGTGTTDAGGAATETTEGSGGATGTTDAGGAATETTDASGGATGTTDASGGVTETTDASGGVTETTDASGGVTGTTEPVRGTTAPVLDPVASAPVTEPVSATTDPVAPTETFADAVSAPVAAPLFARAAHAEVAPTGSAGSGRVPLAFDVAALQAVDPTLSELSLLLGRASMARARGSLATTLADASDSRPAPDAPESPARSQLSGGDASPPGGGFSLSLFALLLIAFAGLAPLLSERLIATSAPWRAVALVVPLERPG
jgi:hypothetical protein